MGREGCAGALGGRSGGGCRRGAARRGGAMRRRGAVQRKLPCLFVTEVKEEPSAKRQRQVPGAARGGAQQHQHHHHHKYQHTTAAGGLSPCGTPPRAARPAWGPFSSASPDGGVPGPALTLLFPSVGNMARNQAAPAGAPGCV